jgi:hypothetical protein
LGYDLYKNGIIHMHIDNPVEHTGLENSEVFHFENAESFGKSSVYIAGKTGRCFRFL